MPFTINTFMQFSKHESNRFNPYKRHVILHSESKARWKIPFPQASHRQKNWS